MFLLEVNPLVLPDIGLVFWNTIAFLVLLIVLGKFAWKPMLKAISERESGIEEALLRADKMVSEAKDKAKQEYDRIISDAQLAITQQKNAALTDVKNQVGSLVVEVAEKILRKELSNKAEQESYIKQIAEGVKLN